MTNPSYPTQQFQQAPVPPRNGMGTAALVLGIIALLLSWIPIIGFLGFILGALAIVLGLVGIVRAHKGRANNLVIAGIGTGLGIIAFVISIAVFGVFANEVDKQFGGTGTITGDGVTEQPQGSGNAEPAMAAFGDTHTWSGDEAITVSAPREYTARNPFFAAPEGKRYVAVDVTVTNGGDRPYQVMMTDLTAQHGGRVAQENLEGSDLLPNTEIPPGGDVTFTKVWEIGAEPGELQVSVKPNAFAGKTVFFTGQY